MAGFPENTEVGEQVFYFNQRAYNDEFEGNNRGRPDLFDLLLNQIDNYDIQKDRLSEFFDHYYNKLDTEDYITGAVFRDGYQKFYIPDYQRPFSWDIKEHRQFWLEIKDHLDKIDRERAPELYMGSIYISDEDREFEVIDGQQRLISLTILFKTIQRYLDLVSTGRGGSDFWEFVEFCYGPRFLGELLHRANDKPVVEAKEDDHEYLTLVFESGDKNVVSTAEGIDPPTEGRTIRLDTLLTEKLGIAPNVVEDNLDSHDPSDTIYYRKPHEYMLKAKRYYESAIGEYIGTSTELIDEDLESTVLEASSSELRLQTTTESVPLAGAHVKFEIDGTVIARETTDKRGECTLSIDQRITDSATITVSKFDKSQTITFDDPSTVETERILVKNVDIESESFQLQILEQDEPKQNSNICVGGVDDTTDDRGRAEFSLNDLSPDTADGGYEIEASTETLKFKGIDELKQLETVSHPFDSDEQRARALINIMQVLLHSMRFVHAKFRDQDEEYKIEVFQSLNDRGKSLGISDIIRARIMASQATDHDIWEEITKRFDRDDSDIQDFLENYIIATQGVNSANESEVKDLFTLRRSSTADITPRLLNDPDDFLEELKIYSKRYREIVDHELPTDLSEIKGLHNDSSRESELESKWERIIARLDRGVEVWRPFVLRVHYEFAQQSNRGKPLIDILETVERIVYRYSFFGQDIASTVVSELFPEACRQYDSGNYNQFDADEVRDDILLPNVPSELRGTTVVRQLITKSDWKTKTATTIFLKLAQIEFENLQSRGQFTQRQVRMDPEADLTIEHILPRKFIESLDVENKKAWLDIFFSGIDSDWTVKRLVDGLSQTDPDIDDRNEEDIKKYFVDDIGNMMLLSRDVNSAVKNRLFSKKIAYYYLTCEEDMRLTGEYLVNDLTTPKEIVKLIDVLADGANIDRADFVDLLGLLVGLNNIDKQTIYDSITRHTVSKSELSPTDYEDVKETLQTLISVNGFDETDESRNPDIVNKFNSRWFWMTFQHRKTELVKDILDAVTFVSEPDEFDSVNVDQLIVDDMERRMELRPSR